MKQVIYIVILLVLFSSCDTQGKPKKPDNLIGKDKMENILYDLYVINAAKGVNRKLLETKGIVPETYVLKKHEIDSAQFADSNAYYAFDPDLYKSIVEKVKVRLEKEKKAFEAIEKNEVKTSKRKRDSIRKAKKQKNDSINKVLKKAVKN
ncbi:DUF4296 domain-containing protein [Winogradskyella sp.]|jgi:hypothetical protein|uniref:DUF4296 domain-containing protein n=1 Tax=Winogradskyella sp. TaxID=1883156 RepID=UPI0025F6B727|nr:DUF4296 domain-containing protein [Winogradskyella sp.]MCT4630620.1 DUF4296 domain-containing protein [Winogradskyella sp.]